MFQDSDSNPRFQKQPRPFSGFRVDAVDRDDDSGESAVRGRLKGRPVEVRYVETSGEFHLKSESGEDHELSRSELRELGPAIDRYRKTVPWESSEAGRVLKAVNEAIFPTSLQHFRPRTVSEVGPVVLLTGYTPQEEIDVVLQVATGALSIIVTSHERKAPRRPLTSPEAWELARLLGAHLSGRTVTAQTSLLALVFEAARRLSTN